VGFQNKNLFPESRTIRNQKGSICEFISVDVHEVHSFKNNCWTKKFPKKKIFVRGNTVFDV